MTRYEFVLWVKISEVFTHLEDKSSQKEEEIINVRQKGRVQRLASSGIGCICKGTACSPQVMSLLELFEPVGYALSNQMHKL